MGTNPFYPHHGASWFWVGPKNGPGLAEKLGRQGQKVKSWEDAQRSEGLCHASPTLPTLAWRPHLAVRIDHGAQQLPGAAPPRSIRIMRRICRKRRLRSADVANTLPWEPASQHGDGCDRHHDVCGRWRELGGGPLCCRRVAPPGLSGGWTDGRTQSASMAWFHSPPAQPFPETRPPSTSLPCTQATSTHGL